MTIIKLHAAGYYYLSHSLVTEFHGDLFHNNNDLNNSCNSCNTKLYGLARWNRRICRHAGKCHSLVVLSLEHGRFGEFAIKLKAKPAGLLGTTAAAWIRQNKYVAYLSHC